MTMTQERHTATEGALTGGSPWSPAALPASAVRSASNWSATGPPWPPATGGIRNGPRSSRPTWPRGTRTGCSPCTRGTSAPPSDCRRVVTEVIDRHGRLDILVNNAGITIDKTVAKMADDDWQRVIAVNLSGAFFMAQAALEHMIKQGTGRIINVSSVIGETGQIGQANYAASKSGLFGLTKSLAQGGHLPAQAGGRHRRMRVSG